MMNSTMRIEFWCCAPNTNVLTFMIDGGELDACLCFLDVSLRSIMIIDMA